MMRLVPRYSAPIFAAVLTIAGCRDAIAPAPAAVDSGQPQALLGLDIPILDNLLGIGDTVLVLQRAVPLTSGISSTKVIGSGGGTLSLPSAGLTVTVPAGAVSYPTVFTVTAVAGRAIAYEFGPHGASFAKPLTLTQDLRVTGLSERLLSYMHFKGGYFGSRSNLINNLVRAVVSELLPATTDADEMVVRFDVSHFSGYLVAVD